MKVTIQDIANSLNMSRNTVSKALNGKPVPIKTKNAVINTANSNAIFQITMSMGLSA